LCSLESANYVPEGLTCFLVPHLLPDLFFSTDVEEPISFNKSVTS
jgi:hypothetical protein